MDFLINLTPEYNSALKEKKEQRLWFILLFLPELSLSLSLSLSQLLRFPWLYPTGLAARYWRMLSTSILNLPYNHLAPRTSHLTPHTLPSLKSI